MGYPDLPATVKQMLANEQMRTHHHLWHFVRDRESWQDLPAENRAQLEGAGWKAPRFEDEPGSGVDFLGMHRQMIAMTNSAMENAADPNWPKVIGWDLIPWDENDPDWPVPDWQENPPPWATAETWERFTAVALGERRAERVQEMRRIAGILNDPARLEQMTLDGLGSAMEWSIHGWMHIRWSGHPYDDGFSSDVGNDWLFVPWSSHVNKHFWKLHGWIDKHIFDWESATGQTADLTGAWAGPPGVVQDMPHMAEAKLLVHLPPLKEVPLPMKIKNHIVEELLSPQ